MEKTPIRINHPWVVPPWLGRGNEGRAAQPAHISNPLYTASLSLGASNANASAQMGGFPEELDTFLSEGVVVEVEFAKRAQVG